MNRRSFLDRMLGLAVIGWLPTLVYPVLRYLKPLPSAGPGGPTQLTPDQIKTLAEEKFVIVPAHGKRVIVFQDLTEQLYAYEANCTHEGCTVQYVAAESIIWCACHNGRFDLDGRVVSGPPPKPLPRFVVASDGDGNISINPGTS